MSNQGDSLFGDSPSPPSTPASRVPAPPRLALPRSIPSTSLPSHPQSNPQLPRPTASGSRAASGSSTAGVPVAASPSATERLNIQAMNGYYAANPGLRGTVPRSRVTFPVNGQEVTFAQWMHTIKNKGIRDKSGAVEHALRRNGFSPIKRGDGKLGLPAGGQQTAAPAHPYRTEDIYIEAMNGWYDARPNQRGLIAPSRATFPVNGQEVPFGTWLHHIKNGGLKTEYLQRVERAMRRNGLNPVFSEDGKIAGILDDVRGTRGRETGNPVNLRRTQAIAAQAANLQPLPWMQTPSTPVTYPSASTSTTHAYNPSGTARRHGGSPGATR